MGEPFRPEMEGYAQASELGVHAMWQLQAQRTQLCKDYLDRWTKAGIDAIICPTTPFSTVEHGKFKHVGYTVSLVNPNHCAKKSNNLTRGLRESLTL